MTDAVEIESSNQTWDELDGLSSDLADSLVEVASNIAGTVKAVDAAYTGDKSELVVVVKSIQSDLENFTSELLLTRSKHERFQGTVKDQDELALCLSIFNDYVILNDRFKAIVFLPMLTITDYYDRAIKELKERETEDA